MNHFSCLFTNQVCFAHIVHLATCNSLHTSIIQKFIDDFDAGDSGFMMDNNRESKAFQDTVNFDRGDEIDFIDYFRKFSTTLPWLIQLSAIIPENFEFNEAGEVKYCEYKHRKKTQWIWVSSMEQAALQAIQFAEMIKTNAILEQKCPL